MVCRSKQHRLLLQGNTLFVEFQDAVGDGFGLVTLIGTVDELWRARPENRGLLAKNGAESLGGIGGDSVRHLEDRGGRTVVDVEGDGRESIEEALRIQQEPCGRATKAVDRLRVVADEGHARVKSTQSHEHVQLKQIHVLELVDENVVVRGADLFSQEVILHGDPPVQEQVIKVQQSE